MLPSVPSAVYDLHLLPDPCSVEVIDHREDQRLGFVIRAWVKSSHVWVIPTQAQAREWSINPKSQMWLSCISTLWGANSPSEMWVVRASIHFHHPDQYRLPIL